MLDQPASTPAVSTTANPERPWPSKQLQGVEACRETRGWEDLIPVEEAGQMVTGGLGKRLLEEVVEVWACFKKEACMRALSVSSTDWICY
eukprot:373294-Hanusia_phi.AAC.1